MYTYGPIEIEHFFKYYNIIYYYLYFYDRTLQTIMTRQRTKMFIACRGLNCLMYVIYVYTKCVRITCTSRHGIIPHEKINLHFRTRIKKFYCIFLAYFFYG